MLSDISVCRRCNRLVAHLNQQKRIYPAYHNAPVLAHGDESPALMIVGLAPGLHGANASGIPFTGDSSGVALYKQLEAFGFLEQPGHDGSATPVLSKCRITNAVKCLPPENKPLADEISNCNPYLREELAQVPQQSVILALGAIAHRAVLKAMDLRQSDYPFSHLAEYRIDRHRHLLASYHCSRHNMNTRRLTESQFAAVFARALQLLK